LAGDFGAGRALSPGRRGPALRRPRARSGKPRSTFDGSRAASALFPFRGWGRSRAGKAPPRLDRSPPGRCGRDRVPPLGFAPTRNCRVGVWHRRVSRFREPGLRDWPGAGGGVCQLGLVRAGSWAQAVFPLPPAAFGKRVAALRRPDRFQGSARGFGTPAGSSLRYGARYRTWVFESLVIVEIVARGGSPSPSPPPKSGYPFAFNPWFCGPNGGFDGKGRASSLLPQPYVRGRPGAEFRRRGLGLDRATIGAS